MSCKVTIAPSGNSPQQSKMTVESADTLVVQEIAKILLFPAALPVVAETGDGREQLVAIKRKTKIRSDIGGQDSGQGLQPWNVDFEIPADFDFEMGQAVGIDAVREHLRQSVIRRFARWYVVDTERVGESHRMAHDGGGGQFFREQVPDPSQIQ